MEKFYGTLRTGNSEGTLEITIPMNICKIAGFKKGDFVEILIKKAEIVVETEAEDIA